MASRDVAPAEASTRAAKSCRLYVVSAVETWATRCTTTGRSVAGISSLRQARESFHAVEPANDAVGVVGLHEGIFDDAGELGGIAKAEFSPSDSGCAAGAAAVLAVALDAVDDIAVPGGELVVHLAEGALGGGQTSEQQVRVVGPVVARVACARLRAMSASSFVRLISSLSWSFMVVLLSCDCEGGPRVRPTRDGYSMSGLELRRTVATARLRSGPMLSA